MVTGEQKPILYGAADGSPLTDAARCRLILLLETTANLLGIVSRMIRSHENVILHVERLLDALPKPR
jgi:hypothetical protein